MWPSYVGQGSLIAFSSLSALHNVLATRPLFVRERSNAYYRSARFISRILFHVVLTRSFFFFVPIARRLGCSFAFFSTSSRSA